jgi:hypothetical protein
MISSLLAGLGMFGMSKLTAPKAPKPTPMPLVDFNRETVEAMQARRDAQDPQMRGLMEQQYRTALSMSRGELPDEIQRSIRQTVAEASGTRGLSADQAVRLRASEIGQTQLQMMQQGEQMTRTLAAIRDSEWAVASGSALSKANQAFAAWSAREQARMGAYQEKAADHRSFWSMMGTNMYMGLNKGKSGSTVTSSPGAIPSVPRMPSRPTGLQLNRLWDKEY